MSSQITPLSPGNNPEDSVENNRKNGAMFSGHKMPLYLLTGEGAPLESGTELSLDLFLQSKTKSTSFVNVVDDSDVVNNTLVSQKRINKVQMLVDLSSIHRAMLGKQATAMGLGTREFQTRGLTVQQMVRVNDFLQSNYNSAEGRAASPITYFEEQTDIADSGSDTRTTLGYDSSTGLTRAVIDKTTKANRGTLGLKHITNAAGKIAKAMSGYTSNDNGDGLNKFIAVIPSALYDEIASNGSFTTGALSTNEQQITTLNTNGQEDAMYLKMNIFSIMTTHGEIIFVPAYTQGGRVAGDNNDVVFLMHADATNIRWFTQPTAEPIQDSPVFSKLSMHSLFTVEPMLSEFGHVITGAEQL